MGQIKEPLEIDFYVDQRKITNSCFLPDERKSPFLRTPRPPIKKMANTKKNANLSAQSNSHYLLQSVFYAMG